MLVYLFMHCTMYSTNHSLPLLPIPPRRYTNVTITLYQWILGNSFSILLVNCSENDQ